MYIKKIISSGNIKIVKNGIYSDRYAVNPGKRKHIREVLGIENDELVIGHIGRFSYQKNHQFILSMFYEILKIRKRSKLLLVGAGPLMNTIKKKSEELELSNNVIFYGTTDDVPCMLNAMDCFVLPSRFEGLGIVAIEAQAAGLPLIVSENIPEEACLTDLVTYKSLKDGPQSWASEILTQRIQDKRKDRIDDIIRGGFDIRNSAKELENFYLSLLDTI
jgi:glycosyltransferase involved in cell wall biosynthesis